MALLRVARPQLFCMRQPSILCRTFLTTPILREDVVLPRLKADLKDAMRSKNKPRLNVIRALMAEITNASLGEKAKPIDSDSKLLSLLRKQIQSAEKSIADAESAKREDIVEKEKVQIDIMQAYVDEIPMLKKEDVDSLVDEVVKELSGKPQFGPTMKAVMAKIAGRPVDQSYVTEKIKSLAA